MAVLDVEACLRERLSELEMEAAEVERAVERLLRLEDLLERWSARLGLTSFRGRGERTERYFLEALAACRYLPPEAAMLDIGSGGGSPALPLAVVLPRSRWTLIESRRKKAWFLEEAARVLELSNVAVEARRFGESGDAGLWMGATCRGVRVDARMMKAIEASLEPGGFFLWFSGEARLAEARGGRALASWARVEGPVSLRSESNGRGALLVCRKAEDADLEKGCFT